MDNTEYYNILELQRDSSQKDIASAYILNNIVFEGWLSNGIPNFPRQIPILHTAIYVKFLKLMKCLPTVPLVLFRVKKNHL